MHIKKKKKKKKFLVHEANIPHSRGVNALLTLMVKRVLTLFGQHYGWVVGEYIGMSDKFMRHQTEEGIKTSFLAALHHSMDMFISTRIVHCARTG